MSVLKGTQWLSHARGASRTGGRSPEQGSSSLESSLAYEEVTCGLYLWRLIAGQDSLLVQSMFPKAKGVA